MDKKSALKTKEVAEETHEEQKTKIGITVGRLGGQSKSYEFDKGTKIKDILKEIDAVDLEIRVNGENVPDSYVLKDNDLIVVVPEAIVGGNIYK